MDINKVENQINTGIPLDFGSIFNKSLELFQKVWLQGFVTILLSFICIVLCYIALYIPVFGSVLVDQGFFGQEEPSLLTMISVLIMYPVLLLGIGSTYLALNAAFLRICMQKDMQLSDNDDYFYFFRNGKFKKALVLALFTMGISIVGMLACGIGLFYVMVPLALMPAFLAFNEELTPTEMVTFSFKLGNKNWLVIFGLLFIVGILAELGILLCGVGLLFTAMLAKIPVYYMYKDGVGFSDEKRLEA